MVDMLMENYGVDERPLSDPAEGLGLESLRQLASSLLSEVERLSSARAPNLRRGIKMNDVLRRYEAELIERALDLAGGNQRRAAKLLGVKSTTLNAKIKRLGIPT